MTLGLIADIGGTNARFALADEKGIYEEKIVKCAAYISLAQAAGDYLAQLNSSTRPRAGAMAIAGPVRGDRFTMTNHVWTFSVEETRRSLGLERLHLFNDFEALALGVPHLSGPDLRKFSGPDPTPRAPIGVIGPGTGLGVGSLVWGGTRYHAAAGEGGHVTMPARTQREFDAFQEMLRDKYHHISAERVCSGKGLANLYHALRDCDKRTDLPERTPEEISAAALDGSCALCAEALAMMMGFLGRVAGDLALTLGAFGGIYIAGGIVGQLGPYFDTSRFLPEFVGKGRFQAYMESIPVFLIQHPFPAFVGLQAALSYE